MTTGPLAGAPHLQLDVVARRQLDTAVGNGAMRTLGPGRSTSTPTAALPRR